MKVAIGNKIIDGPWGGGNQCMKALSGYLLSVGCDVVHDLSHSDIEIILLSAPRKTASSAFDYREVATYVMNNPRVRVVQRININDASKNLQNGDAFIMRVNELADHTVFISEWLQHLYRRYKRFSEENATVIRNGADEKVFNNNGFKPWTKKEPLKIVTHHWSNNLMKGHDIYRLVDQFAGDGIEKYAIEFAYIGNIPKGQVYAHAHVLPPQDMSEMARLLKEHHLYVTGAQYESAGMHHIEAGLSGLPLLFRKSGALPEYCAPYGVGFDGPDDFVEALKEMIGDYDAYVETVLDYPYTSSLMCEQYYALFCALCEQRPFSRDELFLRKKKVQRFLRKDMFLRIGSMFTGR